jgi:hypothetical protein
MSTNGSSPRSTTARVTSAHWPASRSAPVGLWQQPWSRTTSPARPLSIALIISSKRMLWLARS